MKRSLSAAALGVGVVAALLGPATPSSAYTGATIKVPLGKTFTVKKAAIPGNSTVFQSKYQLTGGTTAADCAGESVGCEVVPLQLQIPETNPKAIKAKGYILTVVLDWDPGARQNNVFPFGTVYANDVEGFLFQNPPVADSSGSPTFTAHTNSTQPGSMVAVGLTSRKFDLVVANFSGVNRGYTLQFSLTSAAALKFDPNAFRLGSKPSSYVQPTFTPPGNSSPQQNGFGGASGPGFVPALGAGQPPTTAVAPTGPAPIVVPDVAAGTADGQLLAMSNVDVRSGLGLRAVKVSSVITTAKVKESSALTIILALAVLPVLATAGLLLLFRRKKAVAAPA